MRMMSLTRLNGWVGATVCAMFLVGGCVIEGTPTVWVTNLTPEAVVVFEELTINGTVFEERRSYGVVVPGETRGTFHLMTDEDPAPSDHQHVVSIEKENGTLIWTRTYSWTELVRMSLNISVQ